MEVKTMRIHPRRIKDYKEVEEVLSSLDALGQEDCGVALLQNRQLGGSYHFVSKQEYESYRSQNGRGEFFCKFWPRSYFEKLRDDFKIQKRPLRAI